MGMVKRFCHRVIYLQQGRERARGAPDEMVELYWLDLRDEHRRGAIGEGEAVTVKPFLGQRPGIAFGTDEGRIVSACFTTTNGMSSSYMTGEEVELKVAVQFRRSLPRPCLSILIQDRRMLELGGKSFPITPTAEVDGWHTATLGTRFRANLAAGRYHITVRLESRDTDRVFWPVDKQVGLLSFEVLRSGSDFLGAVDLGLEMV
jgi:lipopolysaccharide transport system ATP-binding protein